MIYLGIFLTVVFMYLTQVTIENVRSIRHYSWRSEAQTSAGWHVFLGENGVGKTTFLECIALALVGARGADALRRDWDTWLRRDNQLGRVTLEVVYPQKALDQQPKHRSFCVELRRTSHGVELVDVHHPPTQHPADYFLAGAFACSFGAYRRLDHGTPRVGEVSANSPLYPHLSLFEATICLNECLDWLQDLQFKKFEGFAQGDLLEPLIRFINESHMLRDITLEEVTPKGIFFKDDKRVEPGQLASGHQSILLIVLDMIRQMTEAFGYDKVFVPIEDRLICGLPGLVIIDEGDAHLHPLWLKDLGPWMVQHFPRVQFLVTANNPMICRQTEKSEVYRILRDPAPTP